ncbi:MAG: glycosyltransferase family 2 protein [Thermodesulfobacteriota bacterium]
MDTPKETGAVLISVVVPLYNEEANVLPLMQRLREVFTNIGCVWEVVFALDPSPDQTHERIRQLIEEGYPIRLVTFSRRIGKPLSLLAGLDYSRGDAVITIDADLQDPPELIQEMVAKWREGFKVVIAQRRSRKGEHLLYLKCAQLFYWLLDKISEVKIPRNTGDFRLLDARVVREIRRFRERHGFLRGLTALVGFPTTVVPFDRDPRRSGKTQISLLGAMNIALDGIVPLSRVPLRLMFVLGAILLLAGILGGAAWLLCGLVAGFSARWPLTSLGLLMVGLSGLVIACMGILGEYVARTYEEARPRPLYIVDELIEATSLAKKVSDERQLQAP